MWWVGLLKDDVGGPNLKEDVGWPDPLEVGSPAAGTLSSSLRNLKADAGGLNPPEVASSAVDTRPSSLRNDPVTSML